MRRCSHDDDDDVMVVVLCHEHVYSLQLAADDKWGDWRPHLSIILSNPTSRPELDRKSVTTLGDTLGGWIWPCALASRWLSYFHLYLYINYKILVCSDL